MRETTPIAELCKNVFVAAVVGLITVTVFIVQVLR
jgi:hypothetical protein